MTAEMSRAGPLTGSSLSVECGYDADDLDRIASRLLANDCIECWYIQGLDRNDLVPEAFPHAPVRPFACEG